MMMFTRRRLLQASALTGTALGLPWPFVRGAHAATEVGLLGELLASQFENELPNPLDPGFIFTPRGQSRYEIGAAETNADVLGIEGKETTVWGYKNNLFPGQGPTFPGRTFEVFFRRGATVRWTNDLPPTHLLPVDKSLHWADPEHNGRLRDPRADVEGLESVIVTHLHGGHNPSDSDGLPEYWFGPDFGVVGPRWTKRDYSYPKAFEAATLWYHDHALGITRLNVYAGLAGFFILRDDRDTGGPDNPLNLPAFPYEVPIVIQDRCFDGDGQLLLPHDPDDPELELPDGAPSPSIVAEFFGDVIVVNGKAWPELDVEPRNYRLRLLNGSDSRFYILKFQDEDGDVDYDFHVIGTDQGLLFAPVEVSQLLIAPGERYDIVINFAPAEGAEVFLRNFGPDDPFGGGEPGEDFEPADLATTGQIMRFDVALDLDTNRPDAFDPDVPLRSVPIDPADDLGPPVRVRRLGLFEGEDNFGRLLPLLGAETEPGRIHALTWEDRPTENPKVGDVEEWAIYNATEDAHPIHLHLVRFQIIDRESFSLGEDALTEEDLTLHDGEVGTGAVLDLSRVVLAGDKQAPEPHEAGWKDTVVALPEQVTRIRARFDRPGRYVWHCHILSHEDHEMMRPYYVGPIPPRE
jgi:spore coat protein A, manganese oxidase